MAEGEDYIGGLMAINEKAPQGPGPGQERQWKNARGSATLKKILFKPDFFVKDFRLLTRQSGCLANISPLYDLT